MTLESADDPGIPHVYLSTGCLHGEHDYCQSMTGIQGDKRGGRCKFCDALCTCPCHQPATSRGGA